MRRVRGGCRARRAARPAALCHSEWVLAADPHQRDTYFNAETAITKPILVKNLAIHGRRDPSLAFRGLIGVSEFAIYHILALTLALSRARGAGRAGFGFGRRRSGSIGLLVEILADLLGGLQ